MVAATRIGDSNDGNHFTSHRHRTEPVKLHHLGLLAPPNKSTTIDLCGSVLERERERERVHMRESDEMRKREGGESQVRRGEEKKLLRY